ncbi:unnamed protein product [marine sediment metagenome]|uniref:Uncharacterized protein n=1 Tax=marine sediment metagenome TaxID=412755 RepID=X0ZVR0_9ZZZZ
MKIFLAVVLSAMFMAFMCGTGMAGDINPPGLPEDGSGMPTLLDIYNYLAQGTPAPTPGAFKEPDSEKGIGTMKTITEVYEAIPTPVPGSSAEVTDVTQGKKFFSTESGSWGVQTGTW